MTNSNATTIVAILKFGTKVKRRNQKTDQISIVALPMIVKGVKMHMKERS